MYGCLSSNPTWETPDSLSIVSNLLCSTIQDGRIVGMMNHLISESEECTEISKINKIKLASL